MVLMSAMMPDCPAQAQPTCAPSCWRRGRGRGSGPLTRVLPKPLCPVDGVPLIDHALERAHSATPAIAVNVHHAREAIEAHLDGRVHVSVEEPQALGTAGALGRLRPWIDGRATLVVNGDTWCPGSLAAFVADADSTRVRLALAGPEERLGPTSRIAAALMPWPDVAQLAPVPSGLYEASWRRWPTPARSTSSAGTARASIAGRRPGTWRRTWPPAAERR